MYKLPTLPIVLLFSGQGSAYYHMADELYRSHAQFRYWMDYGDKIFYSHTGFSLLSELYSTRYNKSHDFINILYTHPAIFLQQYALTQTLISQDVTPNFLLGASLGEFTAASIAGGIDFELALELVILQAKSFEKYCEKGAMLAILDNHIEYEDMLQQMEIEIAGINFENHFVISSSLYNIECIEKFLKRNQVLHQRLPVNYAYHSRWINSASKPYLESIKKIQFSKLSIPIVSCARTNYINHIDSEYLWDIVRKPIMFKDTILALEKQNNYLYIDIGATGTLSNFTKYNLKQDSLSIIMPTLEPNKNSVDTINKIFKLIMR